MAQFHVNPNGTVDTNTPGPQTDHTPMPSPNAPKPQTLDDIPSVKAYQDARDKKAGR